MTPSGKRGFQLDGSERFPKDEGKSQELRAGSPSCLPENLGLRSSQLWDQIQFYLRFSSRTFCLCLLLPNLCTGENDGSAVFPFITVSKGVFSNSHIPRWTAAYRASWGQEYNREGKENYSPLLHGLWGKHLVKCQGSCALWYQGPFN